MILDEGEFDFVLVIVKLLAEEALTHIRISCDIHHICADIKKRKKEGIIFLFIKDILSYFT